MNNELKQIKKIYGEEMMQLCRSLFPSILLHEGKLLEILLSHLAPTRSFARDVVGYNFDFQNWIYSLLDMHEIELIETDKNPYELMEEAGYTLYECHSEEDIQSFRHYYSREGVGKTPTYIKGKMPSSRVGEELCTFNGGRLERCYVFFAVKKNVDEIQRKDFPNPRKEDAYGTSVISIQFSRDLPHSLSIKNRYNHTVSNPDSTFGNNLDNIIPGLTISFEKHLGFLIDQYTEGDGYFLKTELQYVKGNDGRLYRYNVAINGVYYCNDNIIVKNGEVIRDYADNKERYILADHCLFDLKEKKVSFLFRPFIKNDDAFINSINNLGKIKRIEVVKKGDNRVINILYDEGKVVKVEINKDNAIVGYQNDYIDRIESFFLMFNKELRYLSLKNCEEIGDHSLEYNTELKEIIVDKVKRIGISVLTKNDKLERLTAKELEILDDYSLYSNTCLQLLDTPKIRIIGSYVLSSNQLLKKVAYKRLEILGDAFLYTNENTSFQEIDLPKLKSMGSFCFSRLKRIPRLILPSLENVGNRSLSELEDVEEMDLPKKIIIGNDSLSKINYSMDDKTIKK